ncbi:MAG: SEC-C metal-binding domain-containing protein, partial [Solirubrobacteraceae bacterium]|nr:SEC-C metal-binding domain-containing protein [Solirubrobacteraceae bacterium]
VFRNCKFGDSPFAIYAERGAVVDGFQIIDSEFKNTTMFGGPGSYRNNIVRGGSHKMLRPIDPCFCGRGRRYGDCCGAIAHRPCQCGSGRLFRDCCG